MRARLKMLHYYHGIGHTGKRLNAISNTRAPASSALRLPLLLLLALLFLPARAARAEAAAAGPAMLYQAGRHKLSMLPRY